MKNAKLLFMKYTRAFQSEVARFFFKAHKSAILLLFRQNADREKKAVLLGCQPCHRVGNRGVEIHVESDCNTLKKERQLCLAVR